ncbi:MAG: DUF1934 domain-containing protein [Bacteroidaceae bacterium]|nr:DUF1934 domain-containing protein [Bacteroidaceae bacterium]
MKTAIEILMVLCTSTEYGTDKITERYSGTMAQTTEGLELVYQESEKVEARLLISEHGAHLWRKGLLDSYLEFRMNHQTAHPYVTPEGTFDMGVLTTAMASEFKVDRGKLELYYDLFISGQSMAKNHLKVMWREV